MMKSEKERQLRLHEVTEIFYTPLWGFKGKGLCFEEEQGLASPVKVPKKIDKSIVDGGEKR